LLPQRRSSCLAAKTLFRTLKAHECLVFDLGRWMHLHTRSQWFSTVWPSSQCQPYWQLCMNINFAFMRGGWNHPIGWIARRNTKLALCCHTKSSDQPYRPLVHINHSNSGNRTRNVNDEEMIIELTFRVIFISENLALNWVWFLD